MTRGTMHRAGTAIHGTGILGTEILGITDGVGAAAIIGIRGAGLTAHTAHGIRGIHGSVRIIRVGVHALIHGVLGIL